MQQLHVCTDAGVKQPVLYCHNQVWFIELIRAHDAC